MCDVLPLYKGRLVIFQNSDDVPNRLRTSIMPLQSGLSENIGRTSEKYILSIYSVGNCRGNHKRP